MWEITEVNGGLLGNSSNGGFSTAMIGGLCGGSVLSTTVPRAARGRCCGCCERSQWNHELGDEATKLVKKWDFNHKTGKLDNKTNHTWRLSKIYSTIYIYIYK